MEIKEGEYIAVMGPSGSGKSTLLYSISGTDHINGGDGLFDGINLREMKENELSKLRLEKMGFVFQNAQMLKNLSIFDNIILPGLIAKLEPATAIRKRALNLMKRMEIEQIQARNIREVSGGQLQRASICRAMINHPEILFLDEPTGALNSDAANQAKKVVYIKDGQVVFCKAFKTDATHERELDEWLRGMGKSNNNQPKFNGIETNNLV